VTFAQKRKLTPARRLMVQRTALWLLIIAGCQSVSSQEDATSAFIDPFSPKKQVQQQVVPSTQKSFLPKITLPKLPKIPNLNPFAPKIVKGPTVQKNKPNVFQTIGTNTKGFFNKASHTLMPWTKPNPKNGPVKIVPAFMQQENQSTKKKTSGFQPFQLFSSGAKPTKKNPSSSFFFK
jgi:hypothetical protein